jgi:hypothetical protein
MKYKIVKLDKRHSGHGLFDYLIDFQTSPVDGYIVLEQRREDFSTVRKWCWESWGPADELDFTKWGTNPRWAWKRDLSKANIYFNEAELTAYLLRWN